MNDVVFTSYHHALPYIQQADSWEKKVMASITDCTPNSYWRHIKTSNLYIVEGLTTCATNGENEGQICVSYVDMTTKERYHRLVTEFLDGRFEPMVNEYRRKD